MSHPLSAYAVLVDASVHEIGPEGYVVYSRYFPTPEAAVRLIAETQDWDDDIEEDYLDIADQGYITVVGRWEVPPPEVQDLTPEQAATLIGQIGERQQTDKRWSVELDQILQGHRSAVPPASNPIDELRHQDLKARLMQ